MSASVGAGLVCQPHRDAVSRRKRKQEYEYYRFFRWDD